MNAPNSPIGFFPIDLITEILSRLPLKSLLKSKSVCKSWYNLISETHFIRLQFRNSSQIPQLIVQSPDPAEPNSRIFTIDPFSNESTLSLDFLDDRVKIRASSNGILCCSSVRNRGVYYVCNPFTKQFRLLPRTRDRPFTRTQPFYEATLVGLAFNPISFKFNVLLAGFYRSFGHLPGDQFVCNVFHSDSDSWKRFELSMFNEFTYMNRNQVVHANCSLNWLTQTCTHILVFDLENEIWGKVSLPGEILGTRSNNRVYLLEFEGLVSVIQISQGCMSTFVLKDCELEKWELVDTVNLRCIGGFANSGLPICQNRRFVFVAAQQKVLVFDRGIRVWREVSGLNCGARSMYPLWFSAFAFRASLFPCNYSII